MVSLFHVIERELEWRRTNGRFEGFDSLKAFRPLVAIGAQKPLMDQLVMADYFREFGHGPELSPFAPFRHDWSDWP